MKSIQQWGIILAVLAIILVAVAGCTGNSENSAAGIPGTSVPSALAGTGNAQATGQACTPVTITQSDGTNVTLPCRPERIIVTNSDAAEMLIALGAADNIVGVTDTTANVSYLMEKLPNAENIGNWQTPNIEKMLSLKPNVVISYASSRPKNIDQILAANITVISLDCYRLPTLPSDARAAGILTGHEQRAEEYAETVENATALVRDRVSALPQDQYPEVYFEGYSDLTAAGPGSGSDELLTIAGGKNIAANLLTSSAKVSAEWVVSEKPAYVLKVISAKETRSFSQIAELMENRTGWDTIPAVQQHRVYLFANGIEYGPKSFIGLLSTAKILHPDLFTDIDPVRLRDEYAAEYVSGTNTTEAVYPEG